MTANELESIRQRYLRLFGSEGVRDGECEAIETTLGLWLPEDLKRISTFYSGGLLGGVSHHAIATRGPATNVVEETIRLRDAVSLPQEFMVLAEPPDSLIVIRTAATPQVDASVIWCSAFDVVRLVHIESPTKPDVWPSYYAFFRHLIEQEEEERQEEG